MSGLLFHCHGGGFVAQSSRSHEVYLREWSKSLDVPILSVDYSLAPQAPFPRALEEVLYAYCWALKNCALLGTTGTEFYQFCVESCVFQIEKHSLHGFSCNLSLLLFHPVAFMLDGEYLAMHFLRRYFN